MKVALGQVVGTGRELGKDGRVAADPSGEGIPTKSTEVVTSVRMLMGCYLLFLPFPRAIGTLLNWRGSLMCE